MPPRLPLALPALAAALCLGGCATADRGLVSRHQPIVSATAASVEGCPDWSDADRSPQEGNGTNWGCASALNLAAMIVDPLDLVRGHVTDGTGSAETATRAIKAWRETQSAKGALEKVSSKAGG